jgi:PAS domain S-box-containing protein
MGGFVPYSPLPQGEEELVTEPKDRDGRSIDTADIFRLLVASVRQDALLLVDPGGAIRTWNQGAGLITGYEEHEVVGRHLSILYPPGEQAAADANLERAAREGIWEDTGWRMRRDGSRFWAQVTLTALRTADGSLCGFSILARDLTEVRGHQELLKLSFEAAPNGIVMVNSDGRITLVNAQIENLFGYAREELLGQPIEMLVPSPVRQHHMGYRESYLKKPEARPMGRGRDLFGRRKDGSEFPVEIGLNPIRTERDVMVLSTVVDITLRKQAERELHELNENLERRVADRTRIAEQRTAQLRALAAELTHAEHRERLRLAQTLHDHIQQLLVAAKLKLGSLQRSLAGRQAQVAGELESLLNETVESSRSLAVDLSPPILRDAGLVQALHWLARRFHEKHGLNVRLEAEPAAEPQSDDVRFLLFETIRELLFNVVKHARTGAARVALHHDNGCLQVRVEDQGAGFEPSDPSHNQHEGFGLLHLRERLDVVGGTMTVDAAPGRGTRIALMVPDSPKGRKAAASLAHGGPDTIAAPSRKQPSIRVLVVDDHRIVREGLVGLLDSEPGIVVVGQAANGAEAIERARLMNPDVVIMDINMPLMNGIEATRRIRSELPHIAVIGLSLHAERDMGESMREAGATSYLSKNGPSEDLLLAIRSSVGFTPPPAGA